MEHAKNVIVIQENKVRDYIVMLIVVTQNKLWVLMALVINAHQIKSNKAMAKLVVNVKNGKNYSHLEVVKIVHYTKNSKEMEQHVDQIHVVQDKD